MASSSSLPISLQHGSTPTPTDTATALHLLPFHIAYSGKADIAAYFGLHDEGSRAYFRGRMMLGSSIGIPAGYAGQIWKSNGPSMVAPIQPHSQSNRKRERDATIPSIEYNAESPRRSPRKHTEPPAANKKQKVIVKKKKPVKRQVFAMSPDASPVKETPGKEEMLFQDMLDQKLEEAAEIVKEEENMQEMQESSTVKEEDTTEMQNEAKDASVKQEEVIAEEPIRVDRRANTPPLASLAPVVPSTPVLPSSLPSSLPQTPIQPQISQVEPDILEDSGPLVEKKLMPISTFDKFTIWNPDNALDKGSDEYVRSLNEWVGLAELIHA